MMMWKRWIQRGVLCGLMLGGLVGTAMSAGPPVGQIAEGDHAALAAWYDKEGADLRQRANDMRVMAEGYRKNPISAHEKPMTFHKEDQALHCATLAGMYTKAAEETDQLGKEHRGMLK